MRVLVAMALLVASNLSFADFNPKLIGGKPVEDGEYPEVVYISMSGSRCSATLVGPRVVLTAAHCARGGARMSFQLGQHRYDGRCDGSPLYPGQDHDVSLCLLSRPVEGVKFASIGKTATPGEIATLIGYGCVRQGGGGGNDGILRVGEARITRYSGFDFVTQGNSALCFGDSGGPAYYRVQDPKNEHHYVIGVNSKGNIRDTSYLARTDTEASQEFFSDWARQKGVEICGVNKECAKPQPDPDPDPAECAQEHSNLLKAFDEYKACLE